MKRSAILLGALILALIAAGAAYAVEEATWGEIKNSLDQDDFPLAKKVAEKKITTQFLEEEYGGYTTATFMATGDGGWQEWQIKADGSRTHLIFKPYERMMPEEGGWWEWSPNPDGYVQPPDVPPLPEELTDPESKWWVHLTWVK